MLFGRTAFLLTLTAILLASAYVAAQCAPICYCQAATNTFPGSDANLGTTTESVSCSMPNPCGNTCSISGSVTFTYAPANGWTFFTGSWGNPNTAITAVNNGLNTYQPVSHSGQCTGSNPGPAIGCYVNIVGQKTGFGPRFFNSSKTWTCDTFGG
jgi:hypothetical protein